MGDTKVKVAIEEEEDPWDPIDDEEYTDEVAKDIDKSIDQNYLKDKFLKEELNNQNINNIKVDK